MDLRKSVLKRQLSNSTVSLTDSSVYLGYESAIENTDDSDNSLYFSFTTNDPSSVSDIENLSTVTDHDDNDKENKTVIENVSIEKPTAAIVNDDKKNCSILSHKNEQISFETQQSVELSRDQQEEKNLETENRVEIPIEIEIESEREAHEIIDDSIKVDKMEVDGPQQPETASEEEQLQDQEPILVDDDSDLSCVNIRKVEIPVIQIEEDEEIITDPNANLVNPFTAPCPTPQPRRSSRRSSIVSVQTHYYSPLIRKSVDKRPVPTRRTIFSDSQPSTSRAPVPKPRVTRENHRASVKNLKPTTSKVVNPPTAKASQPIPKPVQNKIPITQPKPAPLKKPQPQVRSVKSSAPIEIKPPMKRKSSPRQQPQKSKSTTTIPVPVKAPKLSQVTTQPCKYCGKKFKESAFLDHWVDKCTSIPVAERKKMTTKREKSEIGKRRTTLFLAPPPKLTRTALNKSLNKSGVRITPKKSLKCHLCSLIVTDAFSFASHVLEHKYQRENAATNQQKEN